MQKLIMKIILLIAALPLLSLASDQTIKNDVMNGYKLSTYQGFEKKWKLVTVRFRKDTGEMRFTYANNLAYKSLLRGVTDYPNGSVFAKISQKTLDDSAFTSSSVPLGARRYQYMVRNKKRHASTDGWGYALFDKDGIVFPEKIDIQSNACAACHRLVPERGFVFSQKMNLTPGSDPSELPKNTPYSLNKITFTTIKKSTLPDLVQNILPEKENEIQKLTHEISRYLFQGTLDEIKPTLTKEAIRSKKPALVLSEDQKTFAIVFVDNFDIFCSNDGKSGRFVKSISSSESQKGKLLENRYCWTD